MFGAPFFSENTIWHHLRYQLSNAVNDDGTYTDGGWYICEEEEKAAGVGQEPMFDGRILQDLSDYLKPQVTLW